MIAISSKCYSYHSDAKKAVRKTNSPGYILKIVVTCVEGFYTYR